MTNDVEIEKQNKTVEIIFEDTEGIYVRDLHVLMWSLRSLYAWASENLDITESELVIDHTINVERLKEIYVNKTTNLSNEQLNRYLEWLAIKELECQDIEILHLSKESPFTIVLYGVFAFLGLTVALSGGKISCGIGGIKVETEGLRKFISTLMKYTKQHKVRYLSRRHHINIDSSKYKKVLDQPVSTVAKLLLDEGKSIIEEEFFISRLLESKDKGVILEALKKIEQENSPIVTGKYNRPDILEKIKKHTVSEDKSISEIAKEIIRLFDKSDQ